MPTKSLRRRALDELANDENLEFDVEEILNYNREDEKYLIKWLGYESPTWEPLAHLEHCQALLNKFRKRLKLKPVKAWGTQLCGATLTEGSKLNPENWVPLRTLAELTMKLIRARFQLASLFVQIGYPRTNPKCAGIFMVSELNHAVGIFYHHE